MTHPHVAGFKGKHKQTSMHDTKKKEGGVEGEGNKCTASEWEQYGKLMDVDDLVHLSCEVSCSFVVCGLLFNESMVFFWYVSVVFFVGMLVLSVCLFVLTCYHRYYGLNMRY